MAGWPRISLMRRSCGNRLFTGFADRTLTAAKKDIRPQTRLSSHKQEIRHIYSLDYQKKPRDNYGLFSPSYPEHLSIPAAAAHRSMKFR